MTDRIAAAPLEASNAQGALLDAHGVGNGSDSDCPSAVKQQWAHGVEPDAVTALQAHPEWLTDRAVVLDLAFDEFCRRVDRGESLDLDAFAERFPAHRTSIRQLLTAHRYIEENPEVLEQMPIVRWPEPGDMIGDLKLMAVLGRGRFSQVYLATEQSTGGRHVAVKLSTDGEVEALTQGPLQHDHIVPVWSARNDPVSRLHVVCMPYLGRATLLDLLDTAFPPHASPYESRGSEVGRDGPKPARVILDAGRRAPAGDPVPTATSDSRLLRGTYEDGIVVLAGQIASALAFLHERDISHRDLKPSNVLLTPAGRAMLMDFNLAADDRCPPDRLGGTIPYMAPEMLRAMVDERSTTEPSQPGGKRVGKEADVFSLGVILYELLTGRHPFAATVKPQAMKAFARVMLSRQAVGFRPLREVNPRVERRFAYLVERCLAADPALRPTAADVQSQARHYFAPLARLWRGIVRRPLRAALAAAVLAATVTLAAVIVPTDIDAKADREFALGREDMLTAHYASATAHFTEANRLRADGRAVACAAHCQANLKKHVAAIDLYDTAIKAGFTPAEVYNNRGYSFMQVGLNGTTRRAEDWNITPAEFLDAAYRDFSKALELNGQLQAASYNRAVLALRRWFDSADKYPIPQEALDDMERALESGPVSASMRLEAARLCAAALGKRPVLKDRILRHLADGIDLGLKATALSDPLFNQLRADPTFAKLLTRPAGLVLHAGVPLTVDPAASAK